jgi:o-succinylbenzoate---CoA ligase
MTLTLYSQTYTFAQLPALIAEKRKLQLTEWEEALFVFLENWLEESDTIQAQTSGSTGVPKKLELKKEQMKASAKLTNQFFDLQKEDTVLLCLSTNYIAGKMMIVRALVGHLHLIAIEPASDPSINKPVKFAAMVPMQVETLLSSTEGLSTMNYIDKLIIGGSATSALLEAKLQNVSTNCYATYGMTETVSHIALRKINGSDSSDEYRALEGVWFEQDERDCLVIHAPHLHAEPFITNDIVKLKNRNCFEWIGRFDNVINSGGVKLFPETIEKKISSLIAQRFYITSRKDEKLGEKVVLVIESEPFTELKKQQLDIQLNSNLGKFEKPREIIFNPRFEETSTGKVKRIVNE